MTRPISDYALIGDCETAALIASDASIDWLCWPRFDSGACFAALLGDESHGRWKMAPAGKVTRHSRRYRQDTLVLETDFETETGAVTVIDFMPVRKQRTVSELVRIVVGRRGRVDMRMELAFRFDYGRIVPWVARTDDGALRAVAGPHAVVLHTPVETHGEDLNTVACFTVAQGDRIPFVLSHEDSHRPPPKACDAGLALEETENYWRRWVSRCHYEGEWRDAVIRSLITVKALTYRPTGGIVAAPTTSLPEQMGGVRNWDYRFCWLRDATFTLLSLINAGYRNEAVAWCDWLLRAVAGSPSQVQPLYGVAGEQRNDEVEIDWLPGYGASAPVRIGNAAYTQLQIDVFGSVMDALYEARCFGLSLHEASSGLQTELMAHLERIWREPDAGLWEMRGGPQHFVHAKVMAWVAFDRAVKSAERFGLKGPVEHWRKIRDEIHAEVIRRGYNERVGAFTSTYDSTRLDASALLIPIVGFLPPDDPRVQSTTREIEKGLTRDGLVLRYETRGSGDGLPEGEGVFLACSFWLVDNLILQRREDEARDLFERLISMRNDLGLLAEQYDVETQAQMGNFPQAFSHFALIDSAFNFAGTRGSAREAYLADPPAPAKQARN